MDDKSCSKGGLRRKREFPQRVMVWLGIYSKGVSPLVIFESDTLDHDRYIKEVLPVALKYGNDMFGDDWTFQQDGAKPHIHEKSQEWCAKNCPSFIDWDHWPPNSSDLNPLDYCVWNEISQVKHSDIEKDTNCAVKTCRQKRFCLWKLLVLDELIISNVPRQRKLS